MSNSNLLGRHYVALFEYDPYKSSTSCYPEKELQLKEGDYVTVYGEMDMDGFWLAEVNGMSQFSFVQ